MEDEIVYHEKKIFTNIDYSDKALRNREFCSCTFNRCVFVKSNLIGNVFEDCTFENCDFSMAIIYGVSFVNAVFKGCKLLGLDFTRCNPCLFSFSFSGCILDYANFFGTKLMKTKFEKCSLKEIDFSEADLTSSVFSNCDLSRATFSKTKLDKADFRTAINFSIDPEYNQMRMAKFSAFNLAGLLSKHRLDIE